MTFRTLPDTDQLPHALYTAGQVRDFDGMAIERFGIPGLTLMERAGQAAFELIRRRWPDARSLRCSPGPGTTEGTASWWRAWPGGPA
jgi:NAD(P)H-hydrate epimerase